MKKIFLDVFMTLAGLIGITSAAYGENPTTPPEDGKLSYLLMDCMTSYGESLDNIVEMTTSGNEVWIKNFIEGGYMYGEIQDNGNIRFSMPQYMDLNDNSALYIYAVNSRSSQQVNQFDLLIREDDGYIMEEGIELWGGEQAPEYRLISSAEFTLIEVYTGTPAPPSNVDWSNEYENCFDFELSFKGENGEELPISCMYWQALINDEPYVAKIPDFMGGEISVIPANMWLYEYLPDSGDMLEWGQIGEGKYRCYLPQYSPEDKISVRTGYKIGDNPVQWSEAITVGSDPSEDDDDEEEDDGSINASPQGTPSQYISACNFYGNISGWSYSETMVQNVVFEDGKLFIEKICGANGWIVGKANKENGYAVFKSPQKIDENTSIYAYYENGSEIVELDEFYFDFTEDENEIRLRNIDGKTVILKLTFKGEASMRWSDIVLKRWTETPATPPEDGILSYLQMDCINSYGESLGNIVEMTTSDNEVWMKNFIEGRYMHGEIQDNGNIRFSMPQYMGLNGNFILYTYAVDSNKNQQANQFDLLLQEDGSYVMEEGIELWGGELTPGYRLISSAKFTPVEAYTGTPAAPSNVVWSNEYENCFDFELSFKGENGEDLPIGCIYWQALINDEPYVVNIMSEETSVIPATMYLYEYIPSTGEMLEWGQIGEGKYRCYLSQYFQEDKICVRAGYKLGDNPVQWSEAIEVGKSSIEERHADFSVKFVDGAFVESNGGCVEVFSLSGMRLANNSLDSGTYIVVVDGKAQKISVK